MVVVVDSGTVVVGAIVVVDSEIVVVGETVVVVSTVVVELPGGTLIDVVEPTSPVTTNG